MPFRKTYEEIEEMILNTALYTPMCRDIVRRAGLVPGGGTRRPRSVIDVFMDVGDALLEQWATDFTGYEQIRFFSESSVPVYVLYSLDTSTAYDPGDYAVLSALDADENSVEISSLATDSGGDLHWYTIPEELRVPIKLTLSTAAELPIMEESRFSAALQVF